MWFGYQLLQRLVPRHQQVKGLRLQEVQGFDCRRWGAGHSPLLVYLCMGVQSPSTQH